MRPLHALLLALLLSGFLPLSSPAARAAPEEDPGGMAKANRAAGLLLLERMRRDRPGDYACLERVKRSDILVVRGRYDQVELVLRELGTPFRSVDPDGFSRASLEGVEAVVVNCPGRIGRAGAMRLRAFVEAGGFLLTTDWAVQNVIETAFPHTIRYTRRPTSDDVVSIRVLRPEHLFLKHVLTGNDRHLWWLENQSYPIEVLDSRRVDVLIESEEMGRKYGAKPVAVTFPAKRGRVVHIVSHFYLQRGELRTRRDRLPGRELGEDLGFAPDAPAMRRLEKAGLGGVPAGKIRSAYSAQQLLANLLVAAKKGARPEVRPEPPDRPEPPVREEPTPPAGRKAVTARATVLRDRPDGEPVKAVPEGLRVRRLATRDGWVKVMTPAGETGWIKGDAIR